MIDGGSLKKGVTLKLNGRLYRVTDTNYHNPGRGAASMQATLLDIQTGQTSKRIFSASERLEDIFVEVEEVEFLYGDSDTLNFMNTTTYEQYEVQRTLFGADAPFLRENMQLELKFYDGQAIDYQLPMTVIYKVTDGEVAVAGDSSGSVTKKVTTETGLVVTVPLFVNVGDNIKGDTRDGSYLTRT